MKLKKIQRAEKVMPDRSKQQSYLDFILEDKDAIHPTTITRNTRMTGKNIYFLPHIELLL